MMTKPGGFGIIFLIYFHTQGKELEVTGMNENQDQQFGQPQADQQAAAYDQPQMNQAQEGPQMGQQMNGQPQMGQQMYGQPQMGQRMYGQPQMGQQMNGQPQMGQQMNGQPQMGQQMNGQPQMGQQMYGQPQMGQQMYGQPQMGQQMNGQPQMGQQMYGQPQMNQMYGQPVRPAGSLDFNDILKSFLGLFSKPATTAENIAGKDSMSTGLIFAGFNIVVTFLLVFFGLLILGMSGGSSAARALYMIFFLAIGYGVIAASLLLTGGVIFKGGMTFTKAMNLTGIFALYETVAFAAGILFALISGGFHNVEFLSNIAAGIAYILFIVISLCAVIVVVHIAFKDLSFSSDMKVIALIAAVFMVVFVISVFDNTAQKIFRDSGICADQIFNIFENARYYIDSLRWWT